MRTLTSASIGLLLILALAACGGSGGPAGEASPSGGEASPAAPEPSPTAPEPSPAAPEPSPAAPEPSPTAGEATTAACEVVDEAGTVQAQASDFTFSPDPVAVTVGTAVTWTNGDPAPHTVTLDDGSCDTGRFGQGESATIRFNAPGTYTYFCAVHPSMRGTVEVS